MMELQKTSLSDFFIIDTERHNDYRGEFIKNFHFEEFSKLGLETNFKESYFSTSKKNVLRGLHFQNPPFDHAKLVSLVSGEAVDVVVDLRITSKSYGCWEIVKLDNLHSRILYIPKGFAHGFYSLADQTILQYMTTTEYNEENDTGIRWNSLGIKWPSDNPIVSDRDDNLIRFKEFNSPFK